MTPVKRTVLLICCLAVMLTVLPLSAAPRITIQIPEGALKGKASGRMYLFTSRTGNRPPYTGPNWFSPEPFYGVDITVESGDTVELDEKTEGFPNVLGELAEGKYFLQVLFDFDVIILTMRKVLVISTVRCRKWSGPATIG